MNGAGGSGDGARSNHSESYLGKESAPTTYEVCHVHVGRRECRLPAPHNPCMLQHPHTLTPANPKVEFASKLLIAKVSSVLIVPACYSLAKEGARSATST